MNFKKIATLTLAGIIATSILFSGCGNSRVEEDKSLANVMTKGELVLGLDATFKPMGYKDENDQIVGFDIDLAQEVCNRMGIKLVKKSIVWKLKEQELNAKNIDCIWNGMSVDATRQKAMNLSEPYMKNAMVFVVKSDSKVTSQADLKGKKVAVQSGSTAQDILEESGLGVNATKLKTNVEALQQLELGLVESVFMDSIVADYEITQSKKSYKILPDGLSEEEYAIGFRKKDQALRDKVQSILSDMKKDGKVAEISKKWFGSDVTTIK